jgi:hypothetical protein
MSIDAMKQALEYTRPGAIVPVTPETVKILVDALRLAIEQAERQEPVAWMWKDGTLTIDSDRADGTWTPLYTAPPLTEIAEALRRHGLTLVETAKGYDVMRLGEISAHGIGGGE